MAPAEFLAVKTDGFSSAWSSTLCATQSVTLTLISAKTTTPTKNAAHRNAHPGSDLNSLSMCTSRMVGDFLA